MASNVEHKRKVKAAIRRAISENNLLDMDRKELLDNLNAMQRNRLLHKKLGAKYGC